MILKVFANAFAFQLLIFNSNSLKTTNKTQMNKRIKYQLSWRTDKGGHESGNNEDSCGLLLPQGGEQPISGQTLRLEKGGLVMMVADGMGGLNAGEVASRIAVDTVAHAFESDRDWITSIARRGDKRSEYLQRIVYEADRALHDYSAQHSECAGMGSTLVIAWLVDGELTVAWCGDSRAYVRRRNGELQPVSHDHSYVQELADKGEIDYETVFSHPNNNIVTHCLGGGGGNVLAETVTVPVYEGDSILLCSDGVSGVLFDDGRLYNGSPLSKENLSDILAKHADDAAAAVDTLFGAAERCGWYDNATAIVCRIAEGPHPTTPSKKKKKNLWCIILLAAAVVAGIVLYLILNKTTQSDDTQRSEQVQDTNHIVQENNTESQQQDTESSQVNTKEEKNKTKGEGEEGNVDFVVPNAAAGTATGGNVITQINNTKTIIKIETTKKDTISSNLNEENNTEQQTNSQQ